MDSSYQNNMTALAGGAQAGATLVTRSFSRFTVVATAGDSAVLPSAAPGLQYVIKNASTNSMNIYPQAVLSAGALGAYDQINNLGVNTPFALAAGKSVKLFSCAPAVWDAILSA